MVRLPIAEGHICYGPGDGNQATLIRTDHWLPSLRPVEALAAQKELFRKYLRAYGPATLNDFVHWSGISMVEVKANQPLSTWARFTCFPISMFTCWRTGSKSTF